MEKNKVLLACLLGLLSCSFSHNSPYMHISQIYKSGSNTVFKVTKHNWNNVLFVYKGDKQILRYELGELPSEIIQLANDTLFVNYYWFKDLRNIDSSKDKLRATEYIKMEGDMILATTTIMHDGTGNDDIHCDSVKVDGKSLIVFNQNKTDTISINHILFDGAEFYRIKLKGNTKIAEIIPVKDSGFIKLYQDFYDESEI